MCEEQREELWLEGGGIRFVYTDDYVDTLRTTIEQQQQQARIKELEKLLKAARGNLYSRVDHVLVLKIDAALEQKEIGE